MVTLGEIRLGIEDLPAGKRRSALEDWFQEGLPAWFDSNLLPVTKAIADRWGRLTIAATAIEHDLSIVTRNISDFTTCGSAIVNPWET